MTELSDSVGICVASLVADPFTAGAPDVRAAVDAALAAGFTEASVWPMHLDAVEGTDLRVAVLEGATAWANGDPSAAAREAEGFVRVAERVGASKLLAVCMEPRIADVDQARRNLDVLVAQGRDAGVQVCVEFLPGTGIPDLASAWALVEPLGPDAGIVLDTWHWVRQRGGPAPDVLATIPGERIAYVQLCDAAPDARPDVMDETMTGRLLPGDGVVAFPALLHGLATIGATPFVATEVFNPSLLAARGLPAAATAMRTAALSVLSPPSGAAAQDARKVDP